MRRAPHRMHYVDLLNSITANFTPWDVHAYVAFRDEQRALDFDRYLTSGSGFAFANTRLS